MIRMARPDSRPARRRAAAAVELALVLPLLITLVLACVDFGRFAYMYFAVINAARAGAGIASNTPFSAGSLINWNQAARQAAVDEIASQTSFDASRLTVDTPVVTVDTTTKYRAVMIRVTYRFETIVAWPLLPTQITLVGRATMRLVR